ncbi:MAG: cation-efflux pump, partial [Alkalinema sp. FL-bin-369]|nr:cation-efflux pump [Leptolyngbyaceae cyanobacterium LF-bin-369]
MVRDNRSQVQKVLVQTLLLNLLVMMIKVFLGWAT